MFDKESQTLHYKRRILESQHQRLVESICLYLSIYAPTFSTEQVRN